MALGDQVSPVGSFTEPEYAQVGLTEAKAREAHDVVVAVMRFDETVRTIVDGRTTGFCKVIADRSTGKILGCHVVGERAVEIVQVVAIAIGGRARVINWPRFRFPFPPMRGSSRELHTALLNRSTRSSAASGLMANEALFRTPVRNRRGLPRNTPTAQQLAKEKSPGA